MTQPPPPAPEASAPLDAKVRDHVDGLSSEVSGEENLDQKLAQIEMAGEEVAAGWKPEPHQRLSPEVRYLHVSRTIHQLITDRNRAVGIYLGVASLMFAASTALLNAPSRVEPIIPLKAIQYWCLPVTFGVLTILAVLVSLLLIRTRIGLIYEVTKMNTLLGLPSQRVERVNPLSIFYIMHLIVLFFGGASAGLMAGMLAYHRGAHDGVALGTGIGAGLTFFVAFQAAYYLTILRATSETKLDKARGRS